MDSALTVPKALLWLAAISVPVGVIVGFVIWAILYRLNKSPWHTPLQIIVICMIIVMVMQGASMLSRIWGFDGG